MKSLKVISKIIITLWFLKIQFVNAANILAIFIFPMKSHSMMINPMIEGLIRREHHITMITSKTLKSYNLGGNYTEIFIDYPFNSISECLQFFDDGTHLRGLDYPPLSLYIDKRTTEYVLQQQIIQDFINSTMNLNNHNKYDLLLTEQGWHSPFHAFGPIFNIPMVTIDTIGYETILSQAMGIITPWSFVPNRYLPYTDHMSFLERLDNTIVSLGMDLMREYIYMPEMQKILDKYFGHLPFKIPSVTQMEKNTSILLLNEYVPNILLHPTSQSIIPVGGLHIQKTKELPIDLKKFLDDATDGAIFFSFGTNVGIELVKEKNLYNFINTFKHLKEHVLWKFNTSLVRGVSKNVLVRDWLPQNDILAHPNVKLFITHGGLFSTMESIYHGVPMLGISFVSDQHQNMQKTHDSGMGIHLPFSTLTNETFTEKINAILTIPKYRENIKLASAIFRDRQNGPLETAMYWIEYVIRHKGARHFRSVGRDLKWYKFYLIDVFAFITLCILTVLITFIYIVKFIYKRICRQEQIKMKQS